MKIDDRSKLTFGLKFIKAQRGEIVYEKQKHYGYPYHAEEDEGNQKTAQHWLQNGKGVAGSYHA